MGGLFNPFFYIILKRGFFNEYAVRGICSDVKRVGDGTW